MITLTIRRKLLLAGLLVLAGCSVQGTEKEVSVGYPADKFAIAQAAAERHCEKYNRDARLVQTTPLKSGASSLFFQTRTSIFECVAR